MVPTQRPALWVGILFTVFYLLTFGGHYYSQDGKELWRVTCSLADGPLFPSQYGILPSLCGLLFYGLGACAEALTGGHVMLRQFFGAMQNSFVCGALVALFFAVAERLFGARRALILSLGLGLATLVWPYSKYDFYEPTATLLLLLVFAALQRWRATGTPHYALLAGAALGLMLHTRLDSLLVFPLAGLFIVISGQPRPVQWRALILLTAGFAPLLLAAAGFNYARFGSIFADPRLAQETFSTPLLYGLYGQLLSPGRSLFLYSPLVLLTFFGWRAWWRGHRPELLFILAVSALYVLLYAQWCNWSANWCYGNRYLLKIVPLLLLPVGSIIGRGRNAANLAFLLLFLLGLGLQVMAVAVEFNDPLNEMLGVIAAHTDYSQVDPMLAVPVWNAGIIDGRGLLPHLYDFGWLSLLHRGLPSWFSAGAPLLLMLLLGAAVVRLLPLLRGLFLWQLLAAALLLAAVALLGYGANSGKHVSLSFHPAGNEQQVHAVAVRNINLADYYGDWRRLYGMQGDGTMVWRGTLDCPVGGVGYRFGLMSHGPAELWLGGRQVLVTTGRATTYAEKDIELLKGRYAVEVRYPLTAGQPARLTLYWHLPYTSLNVIYGEHFAE